MTHNTLFIHQMTQTTLFHGIYGTGWKIITYALGEHNPGRWENFKQNVEPCATKRSPLIVDSCHIRPLLYFACKFTPWCKKIKASKSFYIGAAYLIWWRSDVGPLKQKEWLNNGYYCHNFQRYIFLHLIPCFRNQCGKGLIWDSTQGRCNWGNGDQCKNRFN